MELGYERRGSGEPLVLIHGLGGSRRIWDPVLDRLAAERDVIAVDMPGLRRLAAAARRASRPTAGQPRRGGRRALRRARARAAPPGRQLARRLGRARDRQGRRGCVASAASRRPGSGAGRSGRAQLRLARLGPPAAPAAAAVDALAARARTACLQTTLARPEQADRRGGRRR